MNQTIEPHESATLPKMKSKGVNVTNKDLEESFLLHKQLALQRLEQQSSQASNKLRQIRAAIAQKKDEKAQVGREVKELRDQLAVVRLERSVLGRRSQQVDPQDAVELEQAVTNQVLARRKTSANTEQPITIVEKRSYEKDTIMSIVRDHQDLLVKWDDIMIACLKGSKPQELRKLTTVDDFIDGFAIRVPDGLTSAELRRILKDHGLDVKPPREQKSPGSYWLQLASGPYDLVKNTQLLRVVVDQLRQITIQRSSRRSKTSEDQHKAVLTKLDYTRDIAVTFYAPGPWKIKHEMLRKKLETLFNMHFFDNGNSMASCYQFQGANKDA